MKLTNTQARKAIKLLHEAGYTIGKFKQSSCMSDFSYDSATYAELIPVLTQHVTKRKTFFVPQLNNPFTAEQFQQHMKRMKGKQ